MKNTKTQTTETMMESKEKIQNIKDGWYGKIIGENFLLLNKDRCFLEDDFFIDGYQTDMMRDTDFMETQKKRFDENKSVFEDDGCGFINPYFINQWFKEYRNQYKLIYPISRIDFSQNRSSGILEYY